MKAIIIILLVVIVLVGGLLTLRAGDLAARLVRVPDRRGERATAGVGDADRPR